MFVVPREHARRGDQPEPRNHNHIIYNDVRVPLDHLLGPEDGAKVLAQRRLGGGRIHHAMRTIAQCKLAFDMMCERALQPRVARQDHRRAPDGAGEDRRLLRRRSACCGCSCSRRRGRSTTPPPQEARTDIAAVKYTMAKVLREVSFNALHILGSLGTTDLTPHPGHVRGRADHGHRRRRRRGAQGHRRPPGAQGVPPPRGLLAHRVLSRPSARRRGRRCSRSSTPTPSSPQSAEDYKKYFASRRG